MTKKFIKPTVKHGGWSTIVLRCFSSYSVGPIHRNEGIMDQSVYRDILNTVLEPYFLEKMPIRHTFQHDNNPKYTSKLVKDWFLIEKVNKWSDRHEVPTLTLSRICAKFLNAKSGVLICETKPTYFKNGVRDGIQ